MRDSAKCDSARGYQIQYKKTTSPTWHGKSKLYPAGAQYETYCDTAAPCTNYQWRIRNVCVKNGDTTFSAFVNGPNFKTRCDSGKAKKSTVSNIKISPNPVYNKTIIKAYFEGAKSLRVNISDIYGNKIYEKFLSIVNGKLELPVETGRFNKTMYYVTITDGETVQRASFMKK